MKKIIALWIFSLAFTLAFSQNSSTPFCKYNYRDTRVEDSNKPDTNMIFYKDQHVGYVTCEKIKKGPGQFVFKNSIYDVNMNFVGLASAETGQLMVKYQNPYKVVFVKGMQFDNLVKQMVEVDKRLFPKSQ
jgi:hypothetical protein